MDRLIKAYDGRGHAAGQEWTDQRTDALKRFWRDGKSAAEIAAILNHDAGAAQFTRCAVLGKLHRLGIGRNKPAKPQAGALSL